MLLENSTKLVQNASTIICPRQTFALYLSTDKYELLRPYYAHISVGKGWMEILYLCRFFYLVFLTVQCTYIFPTEFLNKVRFEEEQIYI